MKNARQSSVNTRQKSYSSERKHAEKSSFIRITYPYYSVLATGKLRARISRLSLQFSWFATIRFLFLHSVSKKCFAYNEVKRPVVDIFQRTKLSFPRRVIDIKGTLVLYIGSKIVKFTLDCYYFLKNCGKASENMNWL